MAGRAFAAIVLFLAGGFGAPAGAQQLVRWGEAGGWDVMVDPTLGNGCLIQAEYEDGSLVRIGFDRLADSAYVTAFNEGWHNVRDGSRFSVRFALDDELYDGVGKGIYLEGTPGVDIYFDNPDFLLDLAQRQTMTLYDEVGEVMSIDLEGSYVGIEAALECQEQQG